MAADGGVCFGSFTLIFPHPRQVRLSPESDRRADMPACPPRANNGLMHRSKWHR